MTMTVTMKPAFIYTLLYTTFPLASGTPTYLIFPKTLWLLLSELLLLASLISFVIVD